MKVDIILFGASQINRKSLDVQTLKMEESQLGLNKGKSSHGGRWHSVSWMAM